MKTKIPALNLDKCQNKNQYMYKYNQINNLIDQCKNQSQLTKIII